MLLSLPLSAAPVPKARLAATVNGPKAQLGLPVSPLVLPQPLTLVEQLKLIQAGKAPELPAAQLQAVKVLLVPGFYWDKAPGYFDPSKRRLDELGVESALVPVDPIAPSKDNAKAVRRALNESEKPVIVMAHSKGGRDALEALRGRPKAVKLAAVQTPFAGQALAWLATRGPWSYAASLALGRMLSPFQAARTLDELSEPAEPPPGWLELFTVGGGADLFVSPEKAMMAGSHQALLPGLGHHDWVLEPGSVTRALMGGGTLAPKFAEDLTEALLRWVLASEAEARP